MESKEKQIRRLLDNVSKTVQTWWPWLMDLGLVVLIVLALSALMGCRSTQVVSDTQHITRDSVAVRYKTVLRDSIRIKDSIRIVTKTKVRDSVVLRIDNTTGNIVSREAWHWQDTDNSRDHLTDVGRMINKADSVAREHIKTDSVATTKVINKKAAETNEKKKSDGKPWRRLLRSYVAGLITGGILCLLWKYRRKILQVLKLLIKIVH